MDTNRPKSKSLNLSINAIMFMTLWNVYVWLSRRRSRRRRFENEIKRRRERRAMRFRNIMRRAQKARTELKCLTNYDE